jgi:hypothetical protein
MTARGRVTTAIVLVGAAAGAVGCGSHPTARLAEPPTALTELSPTPSTAIPPNSSRDPACGSRPCAEWQGLRLVVDTVQSSPASGPAGGDQPYSQVKATITWQAIDGTQRVQTPGNLNSASALVLADEFGPDTATMSVRTQVVYSFAQATTLSPSCGRVGPPPPTKPVGAGASSGELVFSGSPPPKVLQPGESDGPLAVCFLAKGPPTQAFSLAWFHPQSSEADAFGPDFIHLRAQAA